MAPSDHARPDPGVDELLDVAAAVADAARVETLAGFRRDLDVEDKFADVDAASSARTRAGAGGGSGDGTGWDPVTSADRAAEAAMRAVLARRRPDDTVRGEELDDVTGTSGLTWVLDPIDGTRSYLAGMPTWGTLVAVVGEDGPLVGMIDQPHVDERFAGVTAGDRREAWLDHRGHRSPLQVAPRPRLEDAILFTSFPEVGTSDERRAFDRVRERVRLTRYSADCYAYAMVAAGRVDLVVEAGLQAHDVAALVPVVVGAGGVATSWTGGAGHLGGRFLAAASPGLHAAAVDLLADPDARGSPGTAS